MSFVVVVVVATLMHYHLSPPFIHLSSVAFRNFRDHVVLLLVVSVIWKPCSSSHHHRGGEEIHRRKYWRLSAAFSYGMKHDLHVLSWWYWCQQTVRVPPPDDSLWQVAPTLIIARTRKWKLKAEPNLCMLEKEPVTDCRGFLSAGLFSVAEIQHTVEGLLYIHASLRHHRG